MNLNIFYIYFKRSGRRPQGQPVCRPEGLRCNRRLRINAPYCRPPQVVCFIVFCVAELQKTLYFTRFCRGGRSKIFVMGKNPRFSKGGVGNAARINIISIFFDVFWAMGAFQHYVPQNDLTEVPKMTQHRSQICPIQPQDEQT